MGDFLEEGKVAASREDESPTGMLVHVDLHVGEQVREVVGLVDDDAFRVAVEEAQRVRLDLFPGGDVLEVHVVVVRE